MKMVQDEKKGNIRFNIDYDSDDIEPFILFLRNLKHRNRVFKAEYRHSAGFKNYHFRIGLRIPAFIVTGNKDKYANNVLMIARYLLGDDFGRWKMDHFREQAGRRIDIIFDGKNGQRAGEWKDWTEYKSK